MIYNIAENKNLIEGIGIVKKSFTFSSDFLEDGAAFYSFCETCDYHKFISGKLFLDNNTNNRGSEFNVLVFYKSYSNNFFYIIAFSGLMITIPIQGFFSFYENGNVSNQAWGYSGDQANNLNFNNYTLDLYFEV